jgi:hypothetical protein
MLATFCTMHVLYLALLYIQKGFDERSLIWTRFNCGRSRSTTVLNVRKLHNEALTAQRYMGMGLHLHAWRHPNILTASNKVSIIQHIKYRVPLSHFRKIAFLFLSFAQREIVTSSFCGFLSRSFRSTRASRYALVHC